MPHKLIFVIKLSRWDIALFSSFLYISCDNKKQKIAIKCEKILKSIKEKIKLKKIKLNYKKCKKKFII